MGFRFLFSWLELCLADVRSNLYVDYFLFACKRFEHAEVLTVYQHFFTATISNFFRTKLFPGFVYLGSRTVERFSTNSGIE